MLASRSLSRGLGGLLAPARPSSSLTQHTTAAAAAAAATQHTSRTALLPATTARPFSTTPPTSYKQKRIRDSDIPIPSPTAQQPEIPPYPYGERQTYKQSNTGLYGGASIRFGNNVSERYSVKTRRKWRPNVQSRRLWSEALGAMVRTRITTRVLRTVDKVGGLDSYLLGIKTQRIRDLGPWGWRLRWRIMQTPWYRAKFAREMLQLGLPLDGGLAAGQADALPDGHTAESLMKETQEMLDADKEFDIGDLEPEVPEAGFMEEAKRPGRNEVRA